MPKTPSRRQIAAALLKVAKRLLAYGEPETPLDAQYEAFRDWCDGKGLVEKKRDPREHEAVYEDHYGYLRFFCEEFQGDALYIEAGDLSADGRGKYHRVKKWEFRPTDSPRTVEGKLNSFAADTHLDLIRRKVTMPREQFLKAITRDYIKAFQSIPGIERASLDDYNSCPDGWIATFLLKLKPGKGERVFEVNVPNLVKRVEKCAIDNDDVEVTLTPQVDRRSRDTGGKESYGYDISFLEVQVEIHEQLTRK